MTSYDKSPDYPWPDGHSMNLLLAGRIGFDALMTDICAGWGFCGDLKDGKFTHITDFIPESGSVSADQFVEWVFLADNMDPYAEPNRWKHLMDKVRAAFIRHMGAQEVDASLLRWGDMIK